MPAINQTMRCKVYDAVLPQVRTRRHRPVGHEVEGFHTVVPGHEPHYLVRFLAAKTQPGKTIKARLLCRSFDITRLLHGWIVDQAVLTRRPEPWVLSSEDRIRKHGDRLRRAWPIFRFLAENS